VEWTSLAHRTSSWLADEDCSSAPIHGHVGVLEVGDKRRLSAEDGTVHGRRNRKQFDEDEWLELTVTYATEMSDVDGRRLAERPTSIDGSQSQQRSLSPMSLFGIGVGAPSALWGARHFCPKNMYEKLTKCPNIT